jgi:hypothetical protein
MSDSKKVSAGESPEAIAYRLLLHIMDVEGRPLSGDGPHNAKLNRSVILDGYADCLDAVRGVRQKRAARVVPAQG